MSQRRTLAAVDRDREILQHLLEDTVTRVRRIEEDRARHRASLDHDFDEIQSAIGTLLERVAALENGTRRR
jgi:hypothetical protein